MRAVIDLGTNTFHLLVGDTRDGKLEPVFTLQIPVKIGKGGINRGKITDEAFERGMNALATFRKHIDELGIKDVRTVGTSAIRNAQNGSQFVKEALEAYGFDIRVISGEVEAACIYEGVRHSFDLPDEHVLVMDIGGGSVEFIIGMKEQIIWKQSFELGAARLIDLFFNHDPVDTEEVKKLDAYLEEHLRPLAGAISKYPSQILVGAAGAFETLRDVVVHDLHGTAIPLSRNASEIKGSDAEAFYKLMIVSGKAGREALKGMITFRVEMITAAAILMRFVMRKFQMQRLIVSDYSLKEGLLFESF